MQLFSAVLQGIFQSSRSPHRPSALRDDDHLSLRGVCPDAAIPQILPAGCAPIKKRAPRDPFSLALLLNYFRVTFAPAFSSSAFMF